MSALASSSTFSVTPGLVPGAREHERDSASPGATTAPSVIPCHRDKPGGDENLFIGETRQPNLALL